MALARVQATGKVTAVGPSVSATFASPPTVGNGIVVAVAFWWTSSPNIPTCTDNRGNTYSLAISSFAAGTNGVAIFYCPLVATTGTPFTITLGSAGAGTSLLAAAIEVSGVGLGLRVDGSVAATGGSATPATGSTGTLTTNNIFAVALHLILTNQASITVASVSPAWTEEAEALTSLAGEIDSRVLTTASGTTTSASWTDITGSTWRAAIAAFAAGEPAASVRVSQDAIELLSQPVLPPSHISQSVVEILGSTASFAPTTTVTQAPVEILSREEHPGHITQLCLELFVAHLVPARATQLAVEVFHPILIPVRTTQIATEYFEARPAVVRTTQMVVELFMPPPVPVPPEPPPPAGEIRLSRQWWLHRLDLKPRIEETA